MKPDSKQAKSQQSVKPRAAAKKPLRPQVSLKKKNFIVLGAGVATIIAGFISLSTGSITLAPLLLVLGYCVLIPVGILIK